MRLYEIDINRRRQIMDSYKSIQTEEAYHLYTELTELTNGFTIPAFRLFNMTKIIDIMGLVDELHLELSKDFNESDQIMIALNELYEYFS